MNMMKNQLALIENDLPQFQDINRYLTGFVFCKNFTAKRELFLIEKAYKENDLVALCFLLQMHTKLVTHAAQRFQNSGIPMSTLVNIGSAGLRKAILNYNPNKTTHLSTHCARIIRNEILVYTLNNWNSSKIDKSENTELNTGGFSQNEILAIANRLGINTETFDSNKHRVHCLNGKAAT